MVKGGKHGLRYSLIALSGVIVFYFFLLPIPIVAANVAGFRIQNEVKPVKALTMPIQRTAKNVGPYRFYLTAWRDVFQFVYPKTPS